MIRYSRPLLTIVLVVFVVAGSGCLAWSIFDGPAVALATNSDTLLVSEWVEAIFYRHLPFGSFQLPRTPSLFPDLTLHAMLQLATGSWRLATLIFGWLQFAALILVAALIVHQIARVPRALAAAAFLLIVIMVFALDGLAGSGNITRLRIVVEIAAHGGAFLLTMFAAVLVCHALTGAQSRAGWWLLLAISAVACLSDGLTVLEFHLPVVLTLLLLRREIAPLRAARQILLPVILGVPVAWVMEHALNRQPAVHLGFDPWHLIADSSMRVFLTWYAPAILVFGLIALPHRAACRVAWFFPNLEARFYWRFAALATLLTTLGAGALLYQDTGGFRYFYALAWWPFVLATAVICARIAAHRAVIGLACVLALAVLVARTPLRLPRLLSWRDPLAECLMQHRRDDALQAGLAQYWLARPASAGSDWALQVDPVTAAGSPYYWGNDLLSYRASAGTLQHNFVVLQGLDAGRIRAAYGTPQKTIECPGSEVWVYRDAGMVDRALAARLPR